MTKPLRDPGLSIDREFPTLVSYRGPEASIGTQKSIPLLPPHSGRTYILDKDKDTPDNHVPRDGRLIRLTGVHPFNAEAPLTPLYSDGMAYNVRYSVCCFI